MTRLILISLLVSLLLPAQAMAWQGKVIKVVDGDTIVVRNLDDIELTVRLYGIDTPEHDQPFGPEAKRYLSSRILDRDVNISGTDWKDCRIIGVVFHQGRNLNYMLVKDGMAWVYGTFCKEQYCTDWFREEDRARNLRQGLWSDGNPVPPWDWRKGVRKTNKGNAGTGKTDSSQETKSGLEKVIDILQTIKKNSKE